MLYSTVG